MSLCFTLTGTSNVLSSNYFPPIEIGEGFSIGLLSFEAYHSIPNIIENHNNIFYYGDKSISFPTGTYEISAIADYIEEHIEHPDTIILRANNNTLKTELKCSSTVYFNKPHSIGPILGFKQNQVLPPDTNSFHISDSVVDIDSVNSIAINCNIAVGSYRNDTPVHTIYEFYPKVEPGYKITETPTPVIYLPVSVECISNLTVSLVDQEGNPVNFRNERITVRVHLKKDGY